MVDLAGLGITAGLSYTLYSLLRAGREVANNLKVMLRDPGWRRVGLGPA